LAVTYAALGSEDKLPAAEKILAALHADWPQVAVMGDDWPDLPLFARAAFTCAPANAHAETRARAHHVTALPGGEGAAREFCDLLLAAAGRYRALLDAYTAGSPAADAAS
jgi:3-deoxy-D-manno-octulosonate 8-phosphate phosphatase (KDO 8-P phosphatase)